MSAAIKNNAKPRDRINLFSAKDRPIHLGPYPLEQLMRSTSVNLTRVHRFEPLSFGTAEDKPDSIINAMRDHHAMLDAIRAGLVNPSIAGAPSDKQERANHLKAFGYFTDASIVGLCRIPPEALLETPHRNADIDRLIQKFQTEQPKTFASGIDGIMADLKEAVARPLPSIETHQYAIVVLFEHPRDPLPDEPGVEWFKGASSHRSAILAAESATVIANYLRLLGHEARAHTVSSSDVDLNCLAVAAGVASVDEEGVGSDALIAPFIGKKFSMAAITTTFEMAVDLPLSEQNLPLYKPRYADRKFKDGEHPFESLKRVDKPTTFIDEARVPRVPKRADMFSRALFGDMGKAVQAASTGGRYVQKSAPSMAQRKALGAFTLLQDGESAKEKQVFTPQEAHDLVTATSYFLGSDAVGISRCPEWTWYSHDASGQPIVPVHDQAISMNIDQGYETMEGSSGDDWIAVAMSMRAYLRFSLVGGVIAKQLRNLGYKAKAHTVIDGEVIQPPLLLLSGLGEVSRIGEVILNPYLGPRLKSGVVTTDLPMTHDKPIDFGLQKFCESCQKCARECPSGAITAGPKLMFNGYEIWKSDSQKCTTYRITNPGGAMCGRCMKTCPWNLEGVLADKVLRWTAMNMPASAPVLAKLDDMMDRGSLNPVKKWWWDLEIDEHGGYTPTPHPVNERELQKSLNLNYEDQTLAVYPANLTPPPAPYPYPMDRDEGIEAYQAMITAEEYKQRIARGETGVAHTTRDFEDSPVVQVVITAAQNMPGKVVRYEMTAADGADLPLWRAGAHLDVVVAPEYLRQYSLCGDPADRSRFEIAVLEEGEGRGGSILLQRIFSVGRKVFVSHPINHFPVDETANKTLLMGGGIGVTPMIAFAHRLHTLGCDFELHYSASKKSEASFLDALAAMPWAEKVIFHLSDQGSRADFSAIFGQYQTGCHVYVCGAERYMSAVVDTAERQGYPGEALHVEYFSAPEEADYENHAFTIELAQSGKTLTVAEDKSIAEVLLENGVAIDMKCSDGICGVCKCGLVSGEVEHRDFVLSKAQKQHEIITCRSRAAASESTITLNL